MAPEDVCNLALDDIGARFTITSLNPPLPAPNAEVCARHYQPTIDSLFRAAHWNCARFQQQLSPIKAAQGTPENANGTTLPIPPYPWLYEYALPPDCLKARFLIPGQPSQTQVGGGALPILGGGTMPTPPWWMPETAKFVVASDTDANGNRIKVLLTNLEYAILVYTGRVTDPDLWDSHFLMAGRASLGAWLVNPIKRDAQVMKERVEIASAIITQARVSDGNEGITSIDHMPDWLRVRGDSGFGRLLDPGGYAWYGWGAMGFPGGVLV